VTETIRVGVVGGGFGQHVQVPAFRSAPRVSVDAICASTEARARTFAERLSIPRAFGDWRALIADPELDAVAVSVPPVLQAQIVVAAAAAGKHVFAEKPLGANVAEARSMVAATRAARVVGGIDFEFREIGAWQRAKALLAEGAIGRPRHAYLSWRIETLAHRENKLNWKRDIAQGGGALNLFGSHALDSIVWILGECRCVAGHLLTATPGTADARVEALLAARDGVPVSLSIAADAPFGSGHRFEVYGDDGALVLENRGSDYASGFSLTLGRRGGAMALVEVPPFPDGADGRVAATGAVVRRFVDAIRTGAPMSPSFEDGLRVQELIDAIRDADRRGPWPSPS
jgi:predicted dehydrogenase